MTNPISNQQKQEIIDLHFRGFTNEEIATKLNLGSSSTVSKYVNEHKKGLDQAEYEELIASIRALKKSGIEVGDLPKISNVFSLLKRNDLTDNEFVDFVIKLLAASKKENIDAQSILYYAFETMKLSSSLGVPVGQLPEQLENAKKENQKLEQQIQQNQQKIKESNQSLNKTLDENNIKKESLDTYCNLEQTLRKNGYSGSDIDKQFFMIKNGSDSGYDIKTILDNISQEKSLIDKIHENKSDIESQNYTKTRNEKLITTQDSILQKNTPIIEKIKQLESHGIDDIQLNQLCNLIQKLAKKNNISESVAFEKFYDAIENQYDAKLGFENANKRLHDEITQADKKLCQTRQSLESMENKYKEQSEAIEFLKELQNKGVYPTSIILWDKTIKKCMMAPMQFEQKIKDVDDLNRLTKSLEKDTDILKEQKAKLASECLELKAQIKELEGKRAQLLDLKQIIAKLINTALLEHQTKYQYARIDDLAKLKKEVDKVAGTIAAAFEKSLDISEQMATAREIIAQASFLDPLYQLITTKNGNKTKLFPLLYDIMASMEIFAIEDRILHMKIRNLKEELYNTLTRHAAA